MCFTGDMHVMGVFLSFMIHFLVNSLLSKCLSSIILRAGMHTGSGASREAAPVSKAHLRPVAVQCSSHGYTCRITIVSCGG